MTRKWTVAIIGAGIITKAHAKAIRNLADLELVAVADIVAEKAEQIADQFNCRAYTDYLAMIDQERPDIAINTLPHFLHRQATIECAELGCHVLLEKPMAMTTVECDQIIQACKANSVKLQIGHVQSYDAVHIKVRELVLSKKLGELLMVVSERYVEYFTSERPGWFLKPETAGGGIVMNLGAHSIEIVEFLSGSRIKTIKGLVGCHAPGVSVEGNCMAMATLDNGVVASIMLSGYKSLTKFGTRLTFANGMIDIQYWPSRMTIKSETGKIEEMSFPNSTPALEAQLREFVNAIEGNLEPRLSGHYGKHVINTIHGIYTSSETGKEVTIAE